MPLLLVGLADELEVQADHEDESAAGAFLLVVVETGCGARELEVQADHADDEPLSLSLSLSLLLLLLPLLNAVEEVAATEELVHAFQADVAVMVVVETAAWVELDTARASRLPFLLTTPAVADVANRARLAVVYFMLVCGRMCKE